MKILILYASKYGAAMEIARRIAEKLGDATICDLKGDPPPLADFDRVIIGSSLYAGAIRKEAKGFVKKNLDDLCKKTVGIFLSGFTDNGNYFTKNFPAQLLNVTKAKAVLGGIFDPQKASGFERFVMKAITKKSEYIDRINDDKITEFVNKISGS